MRIYNTRSVCLQELAPLFLFCFIFVFIFNLFWYVPAALIRRSSRLYFYFYFIFFSFLFFWYIPAALIRRSSRPRCLLQNLKKSQYIYIHTYDTYIHTYIHNIARAACWNFPKNSIYIYIHIHIHNTDIHACIHIYIHT